MGMYKPLIAALTAYSLFISTITAPLASQNALFSPTTGTVSGLNLTNSYNNALDSLNTMNSGASAPTNQLTGIPSLGNRWLNSTANPYPANVYDGAQWLAPYYIDGANHAILNQVGGGVASMNAASSTNLCSVPQYFITIAGNTSITGFGTGCFIGQAKKITFSGTPTLTYNSASLIIPGAANVPVSAGDTADVVYLGSGNWQVVNYQPASGAALINPAIDVGDVVMTFLAAPPSSKYLFAYGQSVSRSTYGTLLAGLTITQSVTATNGSPTLTGFSDTTQLAPGMAVEASFLPNGTVIASAGCTSTTCTLNNNATSSTTGNATVFPLGNGCGFGTSCASPSTSFNMPDCRGVNLAGRNNMGGTARSDGYQLSSIYFGQSPNALGVFGGAQSTQLAAGNVPTITSANTSGIGVSVSGSLTAAQDSGNYNSGTAGNPATYSPNTTIGFSASGTLGVGAVAVTSNNTGGSSPTAFSRVQPTLTANCMMRVLAMHRSSTQFAANDDEPELIVLNDRRRFYGITAS